MREREETMIYNRQKAGETSEPLWIWGRDKNSCPHQKMDHGFQFSK
jgi:hypothetical protein